MHVFWKPTLKEDEDEDKELKYIYNQASAQQ